MKKNIFIILFLSIFLLTGCGEDTEAATTTVPVRYLDTTDKVKVDCASIYMGLRTLVMMVGGQSLGANSVPTRYTPRNAVYNFHNGACYEAADPMLGTSAEWGSLWGMLGDKILDAYPQYDNVIFITTGVYGTSIAQWSWGTDLANYLILSHVQLLNKGMKLDAILFPQGEADTFLNTPKYLYKGHFRNMRLYLRAYYVTAPIYLTQSSYCLGLRSSAVTTAQAELAAELSYVFPGPNTDDLDDSYRYDRCHLSDYGREVATDMWMESLKTFLQ